MIYGGCRSQDVPSMIWKTGEVSGTVQSEGWRTRSIAIQGQKKMDVPTQAVRVYSWKKRCIDMFLVNNVLIFT